MQLRSALRAIGFMLALAGLLLTPGLAAGAAGAAASATATPDMVAVSAWGFQGGETITAWLTGPSGQVVGIGAYHQADGEGAASFDLSLNSAAEAGRWTITVFGLDSQQAAYAQVDKQAGADAADDDDDGDSDDDDEDSDTDGDGGEDDDSD
jgi:hypothetical protein